MLSWSGSIVLALVARRIEDLLESVDESVVATVLDLVHLLAPVLVAQPLAGGVVAHQEVFVAAGAEDVILGRARSQVVLLALIWVD